MKNKVAIFGIIVQLAGLIYGVINKAEDIIVMCLIFIFIQKDIYWFLKHYQILLSV